MPYDLELYIEDDLDSDMGEFVDKDGDLAELDFG
jgi:hypothetical protein